MKLDLHRVRHKDVIPALEKVINHCSGMDIEIEIVTGNSDEMKNIVVNYLKRYNINYIVGDLIGLNEGYITITI